MFQKELSNYFQPQLHHVKATAKPLPLDSLYRQVLHTHSNIRQLVVHDLPQNAHDSYTFMLFTYQKHVTDNYLYNVVIDPYTGKAIQEGNFRSISSSFFNWLYSAHYCLQMDKPGRLITDIVTIVFIVNLITGIFIYRKRIKQLLQFKAGLKFKTRKQRMSSIHRWVGVWALLFNFVLFFTGFWMNKSLFLPSEWSIIPKQNNNLIIRGNLDSIVQKAREVKGFQPIAIKISTIEKQAKVIISGEFKDTKFPLFKGKASDIYFNTNSNQITQILRIEQKSFSDRFYYAMKQLHVGNFDILWLKWLYVLIGFCPSLLTITGTYLYFKRKRIIQ